MSEAMSGLQLMLDMAKAMQTDDARPVVRRKELTHATSDAEISDLLADRRPTRAEQFPPGPGCKQVRRGRKRSKENPELIRFIEERLSRKEIWDVIGDGVKSHFGFRVSADAIRKRYARHKAKLNTVSLVDN